MPQYTNKSPAVLLGVVPIRNNGSYYDLRANSGGVTQGLASILSIETGGAALAHRWNTSPDQATKRVEIETKLIVVLKGCLDARMDADRDRPTGLRCTRIGAATDTGTGRMVNEDALLAAELFGSTLADDAVVDHRNGLVLGVFDGCGGMGSGRVASDLAAETVLETLRTLGPERCRTALGEALEQAVRAANGVVYRHAHEVGATRGMGTTATIVACDGDALHLAHVGDSRAYVLREGRLVQVSRDQTLLNHLIVEGKILPEEIDEFPHKNVILHALGVGGEPAVDRATVGLRRGDLLLLCTDGLYGQVARDAVVQALTAGVTPLRACQALLAEANRAGGHDNATVIVARFEGDWLAVSSPEDALSDRNDVAPPPGAISYREAFPPVGDDVPPSDATGSAQRPLGSWLRKLLGRLATLFGRR